MIEYENECVGCPQGCIYCGRNIPTPHLYCDECDAAVDTLYEYAGEQFCAKCFKDYIYNEYSADLLNSYLGGREIRAEDCSVEKY